MQSANEPVPGGASMPGNRSCEARSYPGMPEPERGTGDVKQ